jgi:hypothetical protein
MPDTPQTLRPASDDELAQTPAHALQFDGRKHFKTSGEMMAKITAAHLAECLRKSAFVVMKTPPAPHHRAPEYGPGYPVKPAGDA